MQATLSTNISEVQRRIDDACLRAGRRTNDVKLVAVTKTHPVDVVKEAISVGCKVLGENKVQEAEGKILELGRDNAEWHFIGHLQSNKARKTVQLFDVIHSVDSVELATRLERICIEEGRNLLSIFVQVDLAGEETKSGISETDLPKLIEYLRSCERLRFDGLMILPPYLDDPELMRPYFRRIRSIRDELLNQGAFANSKGELSMGMSGDYEVAIEEGATVVRVGTAIFGERD
ncbi:MAG TPA: YggS family pyridoxal phosphate-dependent enzyme [Pyrinomonadaceae bacterium]|nr:YggS family pyridoxal phosphate-dependent enzyme [Pyrinomonadaceae bacterium]